MTTTADLAVREGVVVRTPGDRAIEAAQAGPLDGWLVVMRDVITLAEHICATSFVPKAYRGNAPAVAAAILAGRELGLPPMTSLRHVQVVEGTPSLSAEYKRARVLAAGHRLDITEHTTEACTVTGHRRGHEPVTVRFTIADARRAGLVESKPGNGPRPYVTRPRRMLFARACTEVCDALFSDLTNGLETTEMLEEDADAAVATVPTAAAPRPEVADLRQRAAAQTTEPRPTPAAPAGGSEPTGDPASEQTAPSATPEPSSDSAPAPQALVGLIQRELTRLEFHERAAKLRACSLLARRPLESSKDLTAAEARDVLDILKELPDGAVLSAVLDDIAVTAPDEEAPSDGE